MTLEQAVKEAYLRISNKEQDPLAEWILDTFALPLARFNAPGKPDLPDVAGWGGDVVEIGEQMTGSWDPDDAIGIATVIIVRAEDVREESRKGILEDATT